MLGTNSAPDPVATITSTALVFPQRSVFDAIGNLWVSDHDGTSVLVFAASPHRARAWWVALAHDRFM